MLNQIKFLKISLSIFIIALLATTKAYATVPDIIGSYTGTATQKGSQCGPYLGPFNQTEPRETFILTINVEFVDTQTGGFAGTGTDSDGGTVSFGGYIDANGNVFDSGFSVNGGSRQTAGTFDGSQFTSTEFKLKIVNAADIPTNNIPDEIYCLDVDVTGTLAKTDGLSADVIVNPELTNSATLTTPQTFNVQIQAIASDVGGRVGSILRGNAIGMNFNETSFKLEGQSDGINAGDELAKGFGAWVSYSRSEFENDFASTAFEGDRNTIISGVDFAPVDNMVLGMAVGYEFSDIDTTVNSGNIDSDGFSVIPYFGYMLSEVLSIDASFGYSWIEADQFRTSGTTRITSKVDSERLFVMANLNGTWFVDRWVFGTSIGLLWADNDQEAFTESNGTAIAEQKTRLRQVRISGNVAYTFDQFEPYVGLSYAEDIKQNEITVLTGPQPSNDSNDYLFSTGFRYFNDNGFTGSFEYSKRLGRDDFEEDTINATLRMDF